MLSRLAPAQSRALLTARRVAVVALPRRTFSGTSPAPSSSYPWQKGVQAGQPYDPLSGYPEPVDPNVVEHQSVIKEFGWRPFVAGLGGLLLFKEIHSIKEESVLAMLTLTGFYVIYIFAGDKILEITEADWEKKKKLLSDLANLEATGLDMYSKKLQLPAHLPPVLEHMTAEQKKVANEWVTFKNQQLRYQLQHETLEKLQKLKATEDLEQIKQASSNNANAVQQVVEKFASGEAALQKDMLTWALAHAGSQKPTKDLMHPVLKVYRDVFAKLEGK
jgi:hypothetical protein